VGKNKLLLIGVAGLAITSLSACHKKPGGQVVAVVNDEEITQQQLNSELQGAGVTQGADATKVVPQILQRLIDRKLMTQAARAEGMDKTPAYLEQLSKVQDELLLNLYAAKFGRGVSLPNGEAVDSFISGHPTLFNQRKRFALDQIVFARPSDPSIFKKLEPIHSLDGITAALNAANIEFKRQTGVLDTATLAPQIAGKIISLPAGEPFLVPQGGQIIVSAIKSAEIVPVPVEQAKPAAVNMLRQKAVADLMNKKLISQRATAQINYAPNFGPPPKTDAAAAAALSK